MSAVYQRPGLLALACLVGACTSASCALLVSYDGFRADVDAGGAGDAAPNDDALSAGDVAPDARPPAVDASSDAADDAANGCRGAVPGVYCGRALPSYTGSVQDLVHCLGDGTMGTVTSCADGCATMPDGRQDVCNPCPMHADAPYCLQEVVLTYPGNDVLIVCSGGAVASASLCGAKGCMSSACL